MEAIFRPLETEAELGKALEIVSVAFRSKTSADEERYYSREQQAGRLFGLFISGNLSATTLLEAKESGIIHNLSALARCQSAKDKLIEGMSAGRLTVKKTEEYILQHYPKARFLEISTVGSFLKNYYEGIGFKVIPHTGPKTVYPMRKQLR
jgi:hypothetical protein